MNFLCRRAIATLIAGTPDFIKNALLFGAILSASISCVEPISVDVGNATNALVVEGWITNQEGPYRIKLSRMGRYEIGPKSANKLVRQAKVSVVDDLNKEYYFFEYPDSLPGNYFSDKNEFKGEVNRSYKLKLEVGEQIYESDFQTMPSVPPIEKLYYRFKESNGLSREGFYVYLDTKDPVDAENFYRWDWEFYSTSDTACGTGYDPFTLELFFWDCCFLCWEIVNCPSCINILADKYINGNTVAEKEIVVVPYTQKTYVSVKVEQSSLTKGAYRYLSAIDDISKNVGSIFDTPPFRIQGNIRNISNSEEVVYGYFSASAKVSQYMLIDRLITKPHIPDDNRIHLGCPSKACPPYCKPCKIDPTVTSIPPPNWKF